MPETPDPAALQARIVTLETVAKNNKDMSKWLAHDNDEKAVAIATRDKEIERLRCISDQWAGRAEIALGDVEKLGTKLDAANDAIRLVRDLLGRIHHENAIPGHLQAEANNWIPTEWRQS